MSFDKGNPKSTPAELFVSGKTAESIVRALVAGEAPDGTLVALRDRYDRKAEKRAAVAAE